MKLYKLFIIILLTLFLGAAQLVSAQAADAPVAEHNERPAASNEEPAAKPRRNYQPWLVGQVQVIGNQQLSADQIKDVMENKPAAFLSFAASPRFEESALERDQERIWNLYRENGYFDTSVVITPTRHEDKRIVDQVVEISEGPQYILEGIELILPQDEDWRQALMQQMQMEIGQPILIAEYGDSKDAVLEFLANNGYPLAQIQGQLLVYHDTRQAHARLLVEIGPRVEFGPLTIESQGKVSHEFIEDKILFTEGQLFSAQVLKDTQQRLIGTGLLSSATFTPLFEQMQDNQVPIVLQWEEAPPHALSLGLGWGTEDEFRVQVYQVNRNLLNLNDTLTFQGKYSAIYNGLTGLWHIPFKNFSFDLQGGARQNDNEGYNDNSLFINPSLTFTPWKNWGLNIGYNAQLFKMRELKSSVPDPDYYDENVFINTVPISLFYDSRDSILNPTKGVYAQARVQIASKALGSDVSFIEPSINISQVIPLSWERWYLAWRAHASVLFPTEDTQRIPMYARYFLGGSQSVRGFRYQNLGPLDSGSRPLGGEAMLETSLELRFPLIGELGGVVFVDAGNAYETYYDLSDGVRFSSGVGLRYNTPLGPVRLDFGYILNPPENYDYSDYQIYLSVGQAF